MLLPNISITSELFRDLAGSDPNWDEKFDALYSPEKLETLLKDLTTSDYQANSRKKSKHSIEPLIESLDSLTITDTLKTLSNIADALMRETFDPKEMLKLLEKTYDAGQDLNMGSSYTQDIKNMITIFVSIGDNFDILQRGGSPKLKKVVKNLVEVYGLSPERKTKVVLNPKRITLLRVAASYPAYVIKLFVENFDVNNIDVNYGIQSCQDEVVLQAPFLAAVLPREAKDSIHHFLLLKAFVDDKILHKTDHNFTDPKVLVNNHRAVFNWTAVDKKGRKKFSQWLGLYDGDVLFKKYKQIDNAALKILKRHCGWKDFLPFKN